jgi:DNA-binding transcriptional LysR family regulator
MFTTLELREVRVFLLLADELHYGRTAERLAITPSRVSQIIRTLETRVGGRLFDRTSRRVRLTPVGQQLQRSLAPLYRDLERAFERAREVATGVAGTLRIGIYALAGVGPHMVKIVRTFESRHPGADVAFVNLGLDRNYLEALRDGEVDMYAVRLPLTEADMTLGPVLSQEQRVLLVSTDDPFAQRESVTMEDLGDRRVSEVMAFPREMMNAFIPPVTPSGRRLRRVENHNWEEMVMRVALGEQVHPTVPSHAETATHPGIMSVPISDLPPSQTALAWLSSTRSPKIHAFARAASDVLRRTELAWGPRSPAAPADEAPPASTSKVT